MMLFGHAQLPMECNEYMFDAQPTVQLMFLLVALLCIPVLLLGKPLYIKYAQKHPAPQLKVNKFDKR